MTTPEHTPPPGHSDAPDSAEGASPEPSDSSSPADSSGVSSVGRPRVVEAVVETERGWNAGVTVILERGGARATGEREAVGEEAVVLRSVAEATLDALTTLLGEERRFALVGAKRMLAFDSAVLLVCVRTLVGPPKRLIGCVPIQGDAVMAVVRAVLHATNRILEGLPNADE